MTLRTRQWQRLVVYCQNCVFTLVSVCIWVEKHLEVLELIYFKGCTTETQQ